MSGEQMRLQVPPKLFGVNSWIAQMIIDQAGSALRKAETLVVACYWHLEILEDRSKGSFNN